MAVLTFSDHAGRGRGIKLSTRAQSVHSGICFSEEWSSPRKEVTGEAEGSRQACCNVNVWAKDSYNKCSTGIYSNSPLATKQTCSRSPEDHLAEIWRNFGQQKVLELVVVFVPKGPVGWVYTLQVYIYICTTAKLATAYSYTYKYIRYFNHQFIDQNILLPMIRLPTKGLPRCAQRRHMELNTFCRQLWAIAGPGDEYTPPDIETMMVQAVPGPRGSGGPKQWCGGDRRILIVVVPNHDVPAAPATTFQYF